jgi:hypothetical protein
MNNTIKNTALSTLSLASAIVLWGGVNPNSAYGITVVAPNQQSNQELSTALNNSDRTYQMQYGASLLTGINIGDQITGLTFRIASDSSRPSSPATTFADYEIYLGQAVNSVANMSATFADNMSNSSQVRDGALSFTAGAFQGGAVNPTTNPFGPVISFDTPYTYQGGDLVVLINHTPGSSSVGFLDSLNTSASGYGTNYRAFVQTTFGATTGSPISMTITQFSVESPTAVPEPVTILGTLLAGGIGVAFKKKKDLN